MSKPPPPERAVVIAVISAPVNMLEPQKDIFSRILRHGCHRLYWDGPDVLINKDVGYLARHLIGDFPKAKLVLVTDAEGATLCAFDPFDPLRGIVCTFALVLVPPGQESQALRSRTLVSYDKANIPLVIIHPNGAVDRVNFPLDYQIHIPFDKFGDWSMDVLHTKTFEHFTDPKTGANIRDPYFKNPL